MKKINTKDFCIYDKDSRCVTYTSNNFITESELHNRIGLVMVRIEQLQGALLDMKQLLKECEKQD